MCYFGTILTQVNQLIQTIKSHTNQVELLLDEKILDCQLEDSEGRTGLMVAAMEGRLGVVRVILRY